VISRGVIVLRDCFDFNPENSVVNWRNSLLVSTDITEALGASTGRFFLELVFNSPLRTGRNLRFEFFNHAKVVHIVLVLEMSNPERL